MNAFEKVNAAGIISISKKIGLKQGRMNSWGPCPACGAEKRGSNDSRLPIGVTPNNCGWYCYCCKASGNLSDLIAFSVASKRYKEANKQEQEDILNWLLSNGFGKTGDTPKNTNLRAISGVLKQKNTPPIQVQPKSNKGPFKWSEKLPLEYKQILHSERGGPVLDYLMSDRKLTLDVIEEADLGCMINGEDYWLVIPLKDRRGTIVNMRFRSIPPNKKTFRVCNGRPMPLYGANNLTRKKDKYIIVTEGELDVLALRAFGYKDNVVSGTTGAQTNWPDEWLNELEPYQGFLIWYDNDEPGEVGASKLAKKLGHFRCFRVMSENFKDAGEMLENNADKEDVKLCLQDVKDYLHTTLKTVDSYADEIEQLIKCPDVLQGMPTGSTKLDQVLGGIRPGLWIVTGDTGHGKTSWATWLLREQALLGVPVMMTSFEQRPIGTVQKLLRMHVGQDFTQSKETERRKALKQMGKMPLYILDHYGEIGIEEVVDSIRFSARRHDVKIALVDHLGFLTTPESETDNERILIEKAVRRLATIAVNDGITIILICHPNNMSVAQQRRVKISDLKGASAIRQDAHVALVVERQDMTAERGYPASTVWVDKVRSEFGVNNSHCTLAFDPISCVYADTWDETPTAKKGGRIVAPT